MSEEKSKDTDKIPKYQREIFFNGYRLVMDNAVDDATKYNVHLSRHDAEKLLFQYLKEFVGDK